MDSNNESNSIFMRLDWFTLAIYLVMVVSGAFCIYAASYDFDQASFFSFSEFSGKQFIWIGLALVLGCVLLLIDRRLYEAYAYPIYGLMLIVLVITIFVAPNIKGSHSWLSFGAVSLQPAEFAKFATALALAKLFSTYNFTLSNRKHFMQAVAIILVPAAIIVLQNETGSALVYFSLILVLYREGMSGFVLFSGLLAVVIFVVALKYANTMLMGISTGEFVVFVIVMLVVVGMLYIYCRSWEMGRNVLLGYLGCGVLAYVAHLLGFDINGYVFFFTVIGASLGYLVWGLFHDNFKRILVTLIFAIAAIGFLFSVNVAFNSLKKHQKDRILVVLGVVEDVRNVGFNVNQSKIAIGSGGLEGKGFLNGTQAKLKFLPEPHTDFIYCTIGEERGFIGATAVLVLYLTLILRIIHIAERQHTVFARVYAYCVASIFMFHLCINVGMVIGLCPVIGIPLPFFSYGGSSLWGFTMLLFILLRIDASRKDYGVW